MAYIPSGNVSFNVSLNANVATGAQVFTAYNVPVTASPIQQPIYATAGGTGALACSRLLIYTGTLASNTSAGSIVTLASGGTADVGGANTPIWAHIREIIVFNDGNSTLPFATTDANILTWDFSFANAWGPGSAGVGPIEGTAPKIDINAGSWQRFAKPFGTAGIVVDATHCVIALSTPAGNAATIAYRIIIMGD